MSGTLSSIKSRLDTMLQTEEPISQPNIRPIRSKDTPRNWPDALNWLTMEFNRLGWARYKVEENLDSKTIRGMGAIVARRNIEENTVVINKKTLLKFQIKDSDCYGGPSVHIEKFGKRYRVYHEYQFDADAVYFMWKLLRATSEAEVTPWYDTMPQRGTIFPFEWYRYSLNQEKKEYETSDPDRCRKIDEILEAYSID